MYVPNPVLYVAPSTVLRLVFIIQGYALPGIFYTVENGTIKAPLVADIVFTRHQDTIAMVFTIHHSKTKRSAIQVPIGCTGKQGCAVCAMLDYMSYRQQLGTLHASSYLFMDNLGRPITKDQLNLAIKRTLSGLGLDISRYSSHSFRSGAATAAHHAGFTESQIQALGHWASTAYAGYITHNHSHAFDLSRKLTSL